MEKHFPPCKLFAIRTHKSTMERTLLFRSYTTRPTMGMVTKIGIKPTLTEHTGSSIHEKANKKSGNVYIYLFTDRLFIKWRGRSVFVYNQIPLT